MGNAAHLESVLPVGHSLGSSLCGGAAQPLQRSAPYRTEALTELLAHAADHIALHRMHQVLLACLTHIYRPPAQAHLALSRAERKAGAALHALLAALGALVPGVALAATRACLLLLAAR